MLILLVILPVLVAVLAAGWCYGAHRWESATKELRKRLDAARVPVRPQAVDFRELEGLPVPVQHFFGAVLKEDQPMVAGVRVKHTGTFNVSEAADRWRPFASDQKVVTQSPGFDWNGRVSVALHVAMRVHDAYIAGEGILHASLFGLFSLVNLRGTDELATGELMRFFAEAAWYPTALLPSQGVKWQAVDDRTADGTLTEGAKAITMRFAFNEQGLIDTVRAEARGRMVGGKIVPTPWLGRFWNYQQRGGMMVPLDGEVAWLLPEGPRPYWRGRITEIAHEFAP